LNDIEKIFYKFLLNGKKDKIKRSIIINEYEEGGLKMPNIQSYTYYHLFLSRDLTIWAGSRRVDHPLTPTFPVSTLINLKKHLSKTG
jgi:hypothetical protein